MTFQLMRRQQFLSEEFYDVNVDFFNKSIPRYTETLHASSSDSNDRRRVSAAIANEVFEHFLLKYSAGVQLQVLRADFENVVASFEQSAKYDREYQGRPDFSPLLFSEIAEYERAVQLIGLCYLFHRRDLLQRVAHLFDGMFAAKDTLYEDLLAYELYNRFEIDKWYHNIPYRHLINSLYRESPNESIADLKEYIKSWYPSMANTPWYDSHLRMGKNGGGGYFGYWAIEAGAVAYLLELDDSSFREHIVYPKDLVDYARKLDDEFQDAQEAGPDSSLLRTPAGNPCPKAGFWFTPAQEGSRRFFNTGEIMPSFGYSAYGATIWQWIDDQ